MGYLEDLRGLMDQNVEGSAHTLRTLLGKVMVEEVEVPGRKRKAWIGHVNGDLVPLMAHASKILQTPDSDRWVFLSNRIWKFTFSAEVALRKPPKYERHAEQFKALHDEGVSVEMIASRYGMSPASVTMSIHFAKTGERPKVTGGKCTGEQAGKTPKYKLLADDVSRLKAQGMSFPKIQAWLLEHRDIQVSEGTMRRAWNDANPEEVKQALVDRTAPAERAKYRHISTKKIDRIKRMLGEDHRVAEIAKAVGCGHNTVYRIRRDL